MKKARVIGCPGSGKTTFAEKLHTVTGLPLYYLDAIWHKPDRTHISREEYDERLAEILGMEEWIIDGNYLRSMPFRLQECDTVFFFDLPREVCLAGAESRVGTKREDMPWTENSLDAEFRQWIVDFPINQLPHIRNLLSEYGQTIDIFTFHSRKEADAFINALPISSKDA